MLDLYCNRYGWQKAVVDAAPDTETLERWVSKRRIAIREGYDYGLSTTILVSRK